MPRTSLTHLLPWVASIACMALLSACGGQPRPAMSNDAAPPLDDADSNPQIEPPDLMPAGSAAIFDEDTNPAVARLPYVPDTLIVQTLPGAEPSDLLDAYSAANATPIEELVEIQTTVLSVDPDGLYAAASALAASPLIEGLQKDYWFSTSLNPDDPRFASQVYLESVGLPEAWEVTTGSAELLIAVLDTGVDPSQPDLTSKVSEGWNSMTGGSGTVDTLGHGTAVAGVATAASNNGMGIVGVSWPNPILPVTVTNPAGQATSRSIAKGLIWAARHNARVANVSFAPLQSDRTVFRAARYFRSSGGLVFISAGNDGLSSEALGTNDVIFVGAVNSSIERASFSTFGPFLDLAAPGTGIVTLSLDGGYQGVSGTSFASPIAAAVAALVWSVQPALRPATVEEILTGSARDLGTPGRDTEYGAGLIDAAAAVAAAVDAVEESDDAPPRIWITDPHNNAAVSGVLRIQARATDAHEIADVVLSIDGRPLATDTNKPFRFVINADRLSPGVHTVTCVATDEFGNASPPAAVRIVIGSGADPDGPVTAADGIAPRVYINFPVDGTPVSTRVGIQATATDNASLAQAEWLIDGALRKTVSINGTRATVNLVWEAGAAGAGSHTVAVRVTDAAGNAATATVRLIKS